MTLTEIMVVIGIIAILVSIVLMVGSSIYDRGKISLTRQTMDTVMSAIEAYQKSKSPSKITYSYVVDLANDGNFKRIDRRWPIPANHPMRTEIGDNKTLTNKYMRPQELDSILPYEPSAEAGKDPLAARTRDANYADNQYEYYLGPIDTSTNWAIFYRTLGSPNEMVPDKTILSIEGLWVLLSVVPESKVFLDKLTEAAKLRRPGVPAVYPANTLRNPPIDPIVVLDAWKRPMRYRLYDYRNNSVPFLWSAGPDGIFGADPNRPESDGYGKDDIFSDKAE